MTERTGWPPGLLQDDDRRLSKWLSERLDARHVVRTNHAHTPGKNGCWNRNPFVLEYPLSNGQMQANFSAGKPCEYTKSTLGQADKGCNGCLWKKLK